MTAEEFLRHLAARAEIVQIRTETPFDEEVDGIQIKGADVDIEEALVVRIDHLDADRFLDLTGLRVE